MSAWDLEATSAFGTQGAIAFPGVDGYSRNLWDTTYDNCGPRVGAAYQVNDRMVLRGGYGVTYLPSNTGYFSGPTDYGSANFSAGVSQMPYGLNPRRRARRAPSRTPSPLVAGDRRRSRTPRHLRHRRGAVRSRTSRTAACSSGTCSSSGAWATPSWCRSATARSMSSNLLNRVVPDPVAAEHRPGDARRLAGDSTSPRNGTLNPATQQVPNPFQPATGARLPFAGPLAGATIARQNTLFPYPLLIGSNAAINRSDATSRLPLADGCGSAAASSAGLMFDASLHVLARASTTPTRVEDNQGFNAGGNARGGYDLLEPEREPAHRLQRRAAPLRRDVLLRAAVRAGSRVHDRNGLLRAIARDWQVSGSVLWHTGFPVAINGASTGAIVGPARSRPRRRLRAAGQPAGLVRRPDDDHAAERASRHAAGEHATCATTRTPSRAAS